MSSKPQGIEAGVYLLHSYVIYVSKHIFIVNHALHMYMYVCEILLFFQELLLRNSQINCNLRIKQNAINNGT